MSVTVILGGKCTPRALLRLDKKKGQTYRRTDGRQTIALRFLLDANSVTTLYSLQRLSKSHVIRQRFFIFTTCVILLMLLLLSALEDFTRVSAAADRPVRRRGPEHAKYSVSHHMVIKPLPLLSLTAQYRSRRLV